jgi:hypothetical protein
MESLVFFVIGMVIVAIVWIAYERWSGKGSSSRSMPTSTARSVRSSSQSIFRSDASCSGQYAKRIYNDLPAVSPARRRLAASLLPRAATHARNSSLSREPTDDRVRHGRVLSRQL